jgi:hypothetical protein
MGDVPLRDLDLDQLVLPHVHQFKAGEWTPEELLEAGNVRLVLEGKLPAICKCGDRGIVNYDFDPQGLMSLGEIIAAQPMVRHTAQIIYAKIKK